VPSPQTLILEVHNIDLGKFGGRIPDRATVARGVTHERSVLLA